jgi:omega-amidase
MSLISKARIALCQVKVTSDKLANIKHVENIIKSAVESSSTAGNSLDLLVLPEIWNSPYSTASFPLYAELIPAIATSSTSIDPSISPSTAKLCELASSLKVWIIGGSIPEYEDLILENNITKRYLYNTCVIINSNGHIVAKHRKMHLFDIDIPGKMTFKESDSLTAGNQVTVFDSPWGPVGVGICYDIRFPEYAMLMRLKGCKLLGE